MTVAELIVQLSKQPGNAPVKIAIDEYGVEPNGNGTLLDAIDVQNNGDEVSIGAV